MSTVVINPHRHSIGYILRDTFTDTNGVNITAHTPNIDTAGGAYSVVAGAGSIQSNQLTTTLTGTIISKNIGIDGGYTATVTFGTGTTLAAHTGLVLRVAGSSSYVFVGHDNGGTNFIIAHRTGGGLTNDASTAFAFATSTTYTLAFTINSSSGITATLNGGNQISGTAAVLTGNNNIGFKGTTSNIYDDLEVI